jgi:hypothetical protein
VGNSKVFSKVAKPPFLVKISIKMCEMISVSKLSITTFFQNNGVEYF